MKLAKGLVVFSLAVLAAACSGKDGGDSTGGGSAVEAKKENPVTANKTGIFELEGEVSNINTVSNTFTLETKEGDVEVYVRAMSRILENGEKKPLSDLKGDSHAKGTFKKFDDKDTVVEIVVTPAQ